MQKTINILLVIVLSFLLVSCATSKLNFESLQGTYVKSENKRIELNLKGKSFTIKDNFEPTHLAIQEYKCCDTIAYGDWHIVDNQSFISLTTPEELNTFYLNVDVSEKTTDSKDITFIINNPIEKGYKKKDSIKELLYSINITRLDGEIINKTSTDKVITVSGINEINMFEIVIYPKCNIPLRNLATKELYTIPYNVEDYKSNTFNVDIPDLTYKYLTLKRMKGDYIRVKSNNKLIWNGKEYIRK